jgi:hypothetical protein
MICTSHPHVKAAFSSKGRGCAHTKTDSMKLAYNRSMLLWLLPPALCTALVVVSRVAVPRLLHASLAETISMPGARIGVHFSWRHVQGNISMPVLFPVESAPPPLPPPINTAPHDTVLAENGLSARYVRAGVFWLLPSQVSPATGQPNASTVFLAGALGACPELAASTRAECLGECMQQCMPTGHSRIAGYSVENAPLDVWQDAELTLSMGTLPAMATSTDTPSWLSVAGCMGPGNQTMANATSGSMCTNVLNATTDACIDLSLAPTWCVLRVRCRPGLAARAAVAVGRAVVVVVRQADEYSPSVFDAMTCAQARA